MPDPRTAAKKLWWRISSAWRGNGNAGSKGPGLPTSLDEAKNLAQSILAKGEETAKRIWKDHRREVLIGGAALLVLILGLAAYLTFKRPSDVLDEGAQFTADEPEAVYERVNWPTYGLNNARTRYLPALKVHPPYKRKWSYRSEPLLEFSPIVVGDSLYAIDNDGFAFSLDARTGKVRWKRKVAKLNATSPAYADGVLYIANMDPSQVMALDAETGRTIWERGLPGRSETSPAVDDGTVVVGTRSGHLLGVNIETGKARWRIKLAGEVKGGVAIKDGIAYIGDYGSEFWAIRVRDGSVKWKSSGQSQGLGRAGRFYATPTVAFDRVYAGNIDGRMYSFEADTGKLAWSHSTGGYVYSGTAVADGPATPPTVYFGSYDGKFYALDAKTGKERWTAEVGGSISGAPSLIGGIVYTADLEGSRTLGFRARDGKKVFEYDSGKYNPVTSDGKRLYLTGVSAIGAFVPVTEQAAKARARKKAAAKGGGG